MADADVVLDCSDNFETRHAVNAACVRHRVPLVSGAAIRFDGQISVYDTRDAACPCYACVFPPDAAFDEVACATLGVFAPLVGIIGTMQAAEALKLLAGVGSSLAGRLQMVDARSMQWSEMRLARQPDCIVCGRRGASAPANREPARLPILASPARRQRVAWAARLAAAELRALDRLARRRAEHARPSEALERRRGGGEGHRGTLGAALAQGQRESGMEDIAGTLWCRSPPHAAPRAAAACRRGAATKPACRRA